MVNSALLGNKVPRALRPQNAAPTKLAHIITNNSCVVPLTETGMEIGDRQYIWEQNRSKVMT